MRQAVHRRHADGPAEHVAERDAAHAARQRRQERDDERELSLTRERAGDGEQQFVGDRQSEDAEHLRAEEDHGSVACKPFQESLFHRRCSLRPAACMIPERTRDCTLRR